MRRFLFILCIITFSLLFSACQSVNVTCADELTDSSWVTQNESGVKAELKFDTESLWAYLTITDQNNTTTEISGAFAVDKDNLYITSSCYKKTYIFGYTVFKDRVKISYNNSEIVFDVQKEKEP